MTQTSVAMSNTGSTSVSISQLKVSGQTRSVLSPDPAKINIPPAGSHTLSVGFAPIASTTYSGQITMLDADSKPLAQLPMQGTGANGGLLTVSAVTLSFGSVTINTATMQSLTLTPLGTAPVTVNSASITGAGFAIVGASFPGTLNPTQSLTLQVQFDLTTTGTASGQLIINSNSSTDSPAVVGLSGAGTAIAHQVDLSWDAPASSPDPLTEYNIYRSTGNGAFALLNLSPVHCTFLRGQHSRKRLKL